MDVNILVQMGTTQAALTATQSAILTTLDTRKNEYSGLIGQFEKSQCEHVTAMKELLLKEQTAISKLAELYTEMVKTLGAASVEISQVEAGYSERRVEGKKG